ncbi:hypothetical protein MMC29_002703 [Sticta canariensis]|nr:hypothetical protein [Sticta canariensis]
MFGPRGSSLAPLAQPPGSFSPDLRSATASRIGTPRADVGDHVNADKITTSEQRQIDLRDKINKETKIKLGSENLLEALISKNAKQTRDQRIKVEQELSSSNRKIAEMKSQLEIEIDRANRPSTPSRSRLSSLFQGSPLRSPGRDVEGLEHEQYAAELESESPTYVLAEILQALELEGMQPDYYVEQANSLVNLFKRYPNLKYDLAWAIFGLRVQTMLLSESRDVVAAGYRVTRHAIADRRSLQIIRGFNTDGLVILSLVKESKASIEREQALKFVRAFLDVKDGVHELSNAVIRTVVSVAEHHEDRLRSMALLTVSELLIRNPPLAVLTGGVASLADTLVDGNYHSFEMLAIALLHLLDNPQQRKYLKSGHELEAAFTPFTDPMNVHGNEDRLKSSARLIAAILKTWPGIFTLSSGSFSSVRSLLLSLYYPNPTAQDLILDLLLDVLHIKPPSWASSYLAGRRLTTYGRVANLRAESHYHGSRPEQEDQSCNFSLIDHFTTLLLGIFISCGLLKALSDLVEETSNTALKRKATLLLGEVLKLANLSLAGTMSSSLQAIPSLLKSASHEEDENYPLAPGMIYQIDRVNRTLYRSELASKAQSTSVTRAQDHASSRQSDPVKPKLSTDIDDLQFRSLLLETQVLTTVNYLKWRWDLINDLIEGPLLNPRRLEETIKTSKFLKRIIGFYQPFKFRFSDARNTKPNQRYVRTGCLLIKTLLQNPEGITYLTESKFIRQLAQCLAELDKMSGATSPAPFFSLYKVSETLTGSYFALLGALSSDPRGLLIMERWRMINMFYHIMDLKDRDDLVPMLLGSMDFSLESHLRVMLSKGLTACPKKIRIYATKLLRPYATTPLQGIRRQPNEPGRCEWAIRLLVTQLYDPEVEVCEVAVQILEEACNQRLHLEYVVRCRPALDHLGEIGAPLLLRFLSTSLGYQYLDGLDYITQEMDDWFLGRNDSYVRLVEASLSRALSAQPERPKWTGDDHLQPHDYGIVPPHFYRELTRTVEGCHLLKESGHFGEFAATIRDSWAEAEDREIMLKVKGCLWAVGNVGSMELGAPFLEETDVVAWIIKIASESDVMTMRGTAFFVLGLVSRSLHGMEILAGHGWNAATDDLGRSLGYCLPPNLGVIFSMKLEPRASRMKPRRKAKAEASAPVLDDDPSHARILSLVTDLGNTVLTKKAAGDLYSLKAQASNDFKSTSLFRKVMSILESHSFRLPVRRFVIDLFDKSVMRHIVLDDESEDD